MILIILYTHKRKILFEVRSKVRKDYDAFPSESEKRNAFHDIMEPRPWELEYADVVRTQTVFTSSTHKVRTYIDCPFLQDTHHPLQTDRCYVNFIYSGLKKVEVFIIILLSYFHFVGCFEDIKFYGNLA
jgi:hypothetical protein